MQISVIIVNFNVKFLLHQCLLSVMEAAKGLEVEIIVVDNNSQDNSVSYIKSLFSDIIIIENKDNIGFSKANNEGVKIANGQYILILNPDTIIPEDSLTKLYQFYEKNKRLGGIGVAMYDGLGEFLPESKRNLPTPIISLKKMFGNTTKYYANNIDSESNGEIEVLSGAFIWIEKRKYNEVSGFDEDYFMFGEDIDLSYKLSISGYKNYYFSKVQIIHYKGESTSKDIKYLNNFYGAMRIFYEKHFENDTLYSRLVPVGIYLWKKIKQLKLNRGTKIKQKYNHTRILYVGSENSVFEGLKRIFDTSEIHLYAVCETRVISRFDDLATITTKIEESNIDTIVFDHQNTSFSKIIFYMINLQKKGLSFKIHPKNTNLIIGSNDRNSKGEIHFL